VVNGETETLNPQRTTRNSFLRITLYASNSQPANLTGRQRTAKSSSGEAKLMAEFSMCEKFTDFLIPAR
jgi:hypothetical protein